jgi:hypothetical protein
MVSSSSLKSHFLLVCPLNKNLSLVYFSLSKWLGWRNRRGYLDLSMVCSSLPLSHFLPTPPFIDFFGHQVTLHSYTNPYSIPTYHCCGNFFFIFLNLLYCYSPLQPSSWTMTNQHQPHHMFLVSFSHLTFYPLPSLLTK